MKRWSPVILGLFLYGTLLSQVVPQAYAAEEALDLRQSVRIEGHYGFACWDRLTDGDTVTSCTLPDGAWVTLRCQKPIGSVYLIFDLEPGPYLLRNDDTGEIQTCGESGFLHDYLDLATLFEAIPNSITLTFPAGAIRLNEVYLFSSGQVPNFVQRWNTPKEGKIDLLLFPAHGDDDQLFFAGLLPLYAGERKYDVLVAYLTNHRNITTLRCHEMLDGLWASGVTNYPIFGPFGDYYSRSKETAYDLHLRNGERQEDLLGFVVTQLRKFKPQVAVGHDVNGEYGHGQHRVYSELLQLGLEAARDPKAYPETAQQWGTWTVPKAYLHQFSENPVVLDLDQPLSRFGGMTAFQVAQKLGFPCHKSQQWGFSWFLKGYQNASDIPKYSPCLYGLYHSTVGSDTGTGDLFENLISYRQQDRNAAVAQVQENVRKAHTAAITAAQERQHKAEQFQEAQRAAYQEKLLKELQFRQKLLWFFILFPVVILAVFLAFKSKIKKF